MKGAILIHCTKIQVDSYILHTWCISFVKIISACKKKTYFYITLLVIIQFDLFWMTHFFLHEHTWFECEWMSTKMHCNERNATTVRRRLVWLARVKNWNTPKGSSQWEFGQRPNQSNFGWPNLCESPGKFCQSSPKLKMIQLKLNSKMRGALCKSQCYQDFLVNFLFLSLGGIG